MSPKRSLAGLGVAEIDALVLAGHLPAATRRLRELTGRTWDEAVNSMRNWRASKRRAKARDIGMGFEGPFKENGIEGGRAPHARSLVGRLKSRRLLSDAQAIEQG